MSAILLLALFACDMGPQTFDCGGKAPQQIDGSLVCDGVIDCWGGQDEREDCATELFYCDQPEPQAVLADVVCDGTPDCSDGWDEAGCN